MNKYKVYFTGLVLGVVKQFKEEITASSERDAINFVKSINEPVLSLKIKFVELA